MRYLVVIDTNVLVGALLSRKTDTAVVQFTDLLVHTDELVPLYDERIFKEYEDVLNRSKLGIRKSMIAGVLSLIIKKGRKVSRVYHPDKDELPSDVKDIPFYEVVLTKKNRASLVTGNKSHFPDKSFVVTPAEFFEKVYQN